MARERLLEVGMKAYMARELLGGGSGLAGAALACCLVAAAVALRCWAARDRRRALCQASSLQEASLEAMGRMVRALRRRNSGLDEETVLGLPLAQLVQKLQNQELSPEAVLCSYLGKAWAVTKEINCVTSYLGGCKAQLAEVAQQPKPAGLLYGVPISLKECFQYKDQDSTLGLCRNIGFPATEDCVVVQVLKKQGAIPFVHTNVPQSMFSKRGLKECVSGQLGVLTSVGPLARDVDSLALCLRALLSEDMFLLDPMVPPVPFRESIYDSSEPLRIGYYETDLYTMPSPSMKRAVLEVKELLEAAGHTLIPFLPANIGNAVENLMASELFTDGGKAYLENFKGDVTDPCLGDLTLILRMPNWLKDLLSMILRPLVPRLSTFLRNLKSRSAGELWNIHHEIEKYREKVITQWKEKDLDVLLTPMLSPALTINYPGKATGAVSYTMLYNCLDFPAGVVPVSKVTSEDEEELQKFKGYLGDMWDQKLYKGLKNSVGMPVAVQCVALPWQDELCLRFMREVERVSQEAKK
ncbi:fatty-acid amide hydrolase 1-like isoform 3-T3 [Sarcophilus harrisii]